MMEDVVTVGEGASLNILVQSICKRPLEQINAQTCPESLT